MPAPREGRPALTTSTALLFIAAGRTVQRRVEAALAEHGLTLRHVGALGHLAANPNLSYSDLGRRAGVTAQSMHATVNRLEELGAVVRHHAGHGRAARLEVTGHGRTLLTRAGEIAASLDDELLGDLPEERRAALARLLVTVAGFGPR
ncbi:MarR family winged helix-turn-helix transcriptional regulator [Micromonospora phytophila]|uniref:MarR family winged helix-turn-helix transcriptional regulator n=1 Tax=Micromonospora phytophila TaxID=709888 RepID=UPI0020300673|nr:MarR family winged helix-turn-helix transcriptional regulator [Micromonospora phytophila]MCM0677499.1 MarR family winged helix-turn-helix transcriptional regulator [Micromonospora phytophila]